MKNAKQVLEGAREIIADEKRWTTGMLENSRGQVCAIGAINKAAGLEANFGYVSHRTKPALRALADVIPHEKGKQPEDVVYEYNDRQPFTSKHHPCVVAAFDAAIERA